jgi:hypothetical protein
MLGIEPGSLGGKREHVPDPVPVWPDMQAGVAIFMSLSTQWRMASGLSGTFATGLDYQAIEPTARMIGVELSPAVFSDVRALESASLQIWNARR